MEVKPGYKTTEFWLSILAVLVAALSSGGFFEDASIWTKVLSFAGATLVAAGYTAARAFTKVGASTATAAASLEAKK